MRGIGKSRLMATFVTVVLVLSMLVIIPKTSTANGGVIITEISKDKDLTCGEIIWINATGSPKQVYVLQIETESSDFENISTKTADKNGKVNFEIHVPYRSTPGDYSVKVVNKSNPADFDSDTITIKNVYKIEFAVGGESVEYVIWNKVYEDFKVQVKNWTGSKYELLDDEVTVEIYEPDNDLLESEIITEGTFTTDIKFNFTDGDNKETDHYVVVKRNSIVVANVTLPVLLDVTSTVPHDVIWGQKIEISGYVKDGNGDGIKSYKVEMYSPTNGGYELAADDTTPSTVTTGKFNMERDTGDLHAGVWYIGTNVSGSYRSSYHNLEGVDGFIWYYKFEVGTDTSPTITITSHLEEKKLEEYFRNLAEESGIKLKNIAQAVRVALTGKTVSPGLFEIIKVLRKERVEKRLKKAIDFIKNT